MGTWKKEDNDDANVSYLLPVPTTPRATPPPSPRGGGAGARVVEAVMVRLPLKRWWTPLVEVPLLFALMEWWRLDRRKRAVVDSSAVNAGRNQQQIRPQQELSLSVWDGSGGGRVGVDLRWSGQRAASSLIVEASLYRLLFRLTVHATEPAPFCSSTWRRRRGRSSSSWQCRRSLLPLQ